MKLTFLGVSLFICSCVEGDKMPETNSQDIKPGHNMVKEYHMHAYWFQTNKQQVLYTQTTIQYLKLYFQEEEALRLWDALIEEVKAGNMTVVCNGITSEILPSLDGSKVPKFTTQFAVLRLGFR